MAIFSLLITTLLTGFYRGIAIWERGTQQELIWQTLLLRQQWIKSLFTQAVTSTYSKCKEKVYVPYFQGEPLQMSWMTAAPLLDDPGQVKPVRLKFERNKDTSDFTLYYQEGALHSDPGRDLQWGNTWVPLLEHLSQAHFSYEAPSFPLPADFDPRLLTPIDKQRYRNYPAWLNTYDTQILWFAPRRVKLQFIDAQQVKQEWQFLLNTDADAWRLEIYEAEE